MITQASWRFIDTGIQSAQWNMALDEALLNGFKEGDLPILRLYGWENALSLGKFSNLQRCIDTQKMEKHKISIVRRITGGGVLVHGGDLSYTLILPRDMLKNRSVKESYHHLCAFLIRLYEKLGHNPRFTSDMQKNETRTDVCLTGNEPYDILINGNKMGGNAQRYTRHVLFHHGTIPMRVDELLFKPFFLGESGLERASTLERLGTPMNYEQLSILVKEAFCDTFDTELLYEPLHLSEEKDAKELLTNKYSQEWWNLHD